MAPNIKQMDMARKFFTSLKAQANRDVAHYHPCFRDCLGDNEEWVTESVAKLIAKTTKIARARKSGADGQTAGE